MQRSVNSLLQLWREVSICSTCRSAAQPARCPYSYQLVIKDDDSIIDALNQLVAKYPAIRLWNCQLRLRRLQVYGDGLQWVSVFTTPYLSNSFKIFAATRAKSFRRRDSARIKTTTANIPALPDTIIPVSSINVFMSII